MVIQTCHDLNWFGIGWSIYNVQKQNDIIQHDIHTQKKSKKATFISKECNVNLMSNDVT